MIIQLKPITTFYKHGVRVHLLNPLEALWVISTEYAIEGVRIKYQGTK